MPTSNVVWLVEERVFGTLVTMGAYMSLVQYSVDGILYEEYLENDEFILCDEDDDDD